MREELLEIYRRLYACFGPRNWWPAETPFEVIVGAILTQNVAWQGAASAIANLKRAGLLTPRAILSTPEEELALFLRPARYPFQKARRLRALVATVEQEFGGDLEAFLSQELEALRRMLLALPGVGEETADCIILYAARKPIFVVDAYTHRVFHRLGYFPERISYRRMQEFFMAHLPPDVSLYNDYHAQIVTLAQRNCLKNSPRCQECPLASLCSRARAGFVPA